MRHEHDKGDHAGWTDLLSEYLDGTLAPDLEVRLVKHLDGCVACNAVLEELRGVVAKARALEELAPPRDLWPALRVALFEDVSGSRPAPTLTLARGGGGPLRQRRFSLTLAQLATAAALVTILAGSAAWALRPLAAGPAGAAAAAPTDVGFAGAVGEERTDGGAADGLELLEAALRDRDRLSPQTVRILEKNLELIDRAIRESAEALVLDPENPYLEEHLRRAQERRLEYLREAAALLEAAD